MTFRYAAKRASIVAIALVCVLASGWTSLAAEPDNGNFRRRPAVCTQQYAPVCGELNGVTKTYPNACFAAADGAKVIAKGPCRG